MARPRKLIPDHVYFTVFYHDDDLRIPDIDTLVYRESMLDEDGETIWLFDRPDDECADAKAVRVGFQDRNLYQVLDFDGVARELCMLAKLDSSTPVSTEEDPAGISAMAAEELRQRLLAFLSDATTQSLKITVRHTDDGFSVCKDAEGIALHFYPRPLRDDTDLRLIDLLSQWGSSPRADYRADLGRTRMLEFPGADDSSRLAELCMELLVRVYGMRQGDSLARTDRDGEGRAESCASS